MVVVVDIWVVVCVVMAATASVRELGDASSWCSGSGSGKCVYYFLLPQLIAKGCVNVSMSSVLPESLTDPSRPPPPERLEVFRMI